MKISNKESKEIIKQAKKNYIVNSENYCKSGKHVVVNYDGSIVPCASFFGGDVKLGYADNLTDALHTPLMIKYQEYDFESVAPNSSNVFESSNCPGKSLYDTNWQYPEVKKESFKSKESNQQFCLRCGQRHNQKTGVCSFCNFRFFDNKPISMVCSCFSLLNPKYFST